MDALKQSILAKVAEMAGIDLGELKAESTLESLGLDSSDAVILAMEVEQITGREVDVGVFLRCATIDDAANELLSQA